MDANGQRSAKNLRVRRMLPAVRKTVSKLALGPEHAALTALAETLAGTIDSMDAGERARLLGQTAPPLLKTLEQLASLAPRVQPRSHAGYGLERLRLSQMLRGTDTRVPEIYEMGCECLDCHTERARRKAESAVPSAG